MSDNFILTFGKQPYNYINRLNDMNEIVDSFSLNDPTEQIYLITGVRGSGKTVLLTTISEYFDTKNDWIVVDLNPNNDLIEELASRLYQNTKLSQLFIKKEFSFSFSGLTFKIEGGDKILTADVLVEKMLEKLTNYKKKILITIDEVMSSPLVKSFTHMFQSMIRKKYNVFLLMTGLYENISELQNSKSLTFLYRAPKIYLTSLSMNSITSSYKNIFNISIDEAKKLSQLTCGYAFAYQLLGYLLQKNNLKSVNKKIIEKYDEYLSQYVYEKVWFELTSAEKDILRCFKTGDSIKVSELVKNSDKSQSFINLYRDRLIKKGIVYSPSYGWLRLSLPRFSEFIETCE